MPVDPTSPNAVITILASPHLPERVRQILQAVNALVSKSLSVSLSATLKELERLLFQQAERAPNSQTQSDRFVELQLLRRHRPDLIPRYLSGLENALARIRYPATMVKPDNNAQSRPLNHQTLSLVENTDLDRHLVVREISRRESTRHNNALLLLGQRFGVLAGTPAFDYEQLPVGPYRLSQILSEASESLQMSLTAQMLLFRAFETQTLSQYGELADQLNSLLSSNGVLPGLVYQPYRRRNPQSDAASGRDNSEPAQQPMSGWQGQASDGTWSGELIANLETLDAKALPLVPPMIEMGSGELAAQNKAYSALRGLLARHRGTENPRTGNTPQGGGFVLPASSVLDTLSALQPVLPEPSAPGQRRRTLEDVRLAALKRLRETHGPAADIPQEQTDTFELLGMLYGEIGKEVSEDAPAQDLLVKLQVPVARVAISDHSFFIRERHPARELLNSVAESGANWLSDSDADPHLVKKLERAVDHVVKEYDGDEKVFDYANREVQKHQQDQIRKAELTERRQIEAARGRDRLEMSRRRSADLIAQWLRGRQPSEFAQTLLNLAWTDVLTLTLLRQGQDSEKWLEYEKVTGAIIERLFHAGPDGGPPPPDPALRETIETALQQVGYHHSEAASIAQHLAGDARAAASKTELNARLKPRIQPDDAGQDKTQRQLSPRTPEEQRHYEQIVSLPFGTWFEFNTSQLGDVRRQRLSWYSPVTGNTLFVNQRGQKLAGQPLDMIARMMARDEARIVTENKNRLIDRAWQATLRTLRGLMPKAAPAKPTEPRA
ncbi:MAG: DUF1631 domain-containing protein [Xanthomonadaceae bacterium]|nr:DUF1631 domain-containing protein [Xanthomonadaceae bacterium]